MRWLHLLTEVFSLKPLGANCLPATPVLCFYGLGDRLLQHLGWSEWSDYEAWIRRLCPRARFHPVASDHYLGGHLLRRHLVGMAAEFFLAG